MLIVTADLCDRYETEVQVAAPIFRDYGGVESFSGPIATLEVPEDNVLVGQLLEQPGQGRVLVVDGGGSLRCALVGAKLAALAHENGWAGVLVNGCVRDTAELRQAPVGIKALNANPLRSRKKGAGQGGTPVTFAGITFVPGHYLYADTDGVIVSPRALVVESG